MSRILRDTLYSRERGRVGNCGGPDERATQLHVTRRFIDEHARFAMYKYRSVFGCLLMTKEIDCDVADSARGQVTGVAGYVD